MAKLKVGDIEIDGSNVRIGSTRLTSSPKAASTVARAESDLAMMVLGKIPSTWLFVIGGASLAFGFLLFLNHAPHIGIGQIVFAPLCLVSAGLGSVALGLGKVLLPRLRARGRRRLEAAQAVADVPLVRSGLKAGEGHATVEALANSTGLDESRVVRCLAFMRKSGEVREDLDTDSGNWIYAQTNLTEGPAESLDERLAKLERGSLR